MGNRYWSCSKFADWVRGTPNFPAGTDKEWNDWAQTAKKNKMRYWLADDVLDCIQDFIYWPKNRFNKICNYVRRRWIHHTHALTSNLKRGQWYEYDTRLLHSMFDSLVDFIEIEQAWDHMIWSDECHKKYHTPWYRRIFRIGQWRCPEAGLEYLIWAASLKKDGDLLDKEDPEFGRPTIQALAAQETLSLYQWWKEVRPKRPDPWSASGLSAYYEKKKKNAQDQNSDIIFLDDLNEIYEICDKMNHDYDEEDTQMLIRLVKLRGQLWT